MKNLKMKTVVTRTNTDNKLLSFLIKTNFGLFLYGSYSTRHKSRNATLSHKIIITKMKSTRKFNCTSKISKKVPSY